MDYKFVCPSCKKEETISMRISEYTSSGHKCKECNSELVRDPKSICCNFAVKCDGFYGKSTN